MESFSYRNNELSMMMLQFSPFSQVWRLGPLTVLLFATLTQLDKASF